MRCIIGHYLGNDGAASYRPGSFSTNTGQELTNTMLLRSIRWAQRLLSTSTLLLALPALPLIADVAPVSCSERLEPCRERAMSSQQIVGTLLRGHYERQRLGDTLSPRVLYILLKDIDSS